MPTDLHEALRKDFIKKGKDPDAGLFLTEVVGGKVVLVEILRPKMAGTAPEEVVGC